MRTLQIQFRTVSFSRETIKPYRPLFTRRYWYRNWQRYLLNSTYHNWCLFKSVYLHYNYFFCFSHTALTLKILFYLFFSCPILNFLFIVTIFLFFSFRWYGHVRWRRRQDRRLLNISTIDLYDYFCTINCSFFKLK